MERRDDDHHIFTSNVSEVLVSVESISRILVKS